MTVNVRLVGESTFVNWFISFDESILEGATVMRLLGPNCFSFAAASIFSNLRMVF